MKKLSTIALVVLLAGCASPHMAVEGLAGTKTVSASFYGRGEKLARHTANGEVFRPRALTAAHRTLPFGTRVKVIYNDRSAVVRINDRGPAKWTGRSIDLSYGAARVLGFPGTGNVKLIVLGANYEEQPRSFSDR